MKISENLGKSGAMCRKWASHLGLPGFCRLENRKVVVGNPTLRVASTDDSRQPRVNSFGKRSFIVYRRSKKKLYSIQEVEKETL